MLLTESILLAMAGGVVGVMLAWKIPVLIISCLAIDLPSYSLEPDWIVFAYLASITLIVGLLAGLAPAAGSLKADVWGSLKAREGFFGQGLRNWRTLDFLIAGELAMSMVFLIAAAICVRAQYTVFAAGPGFEIDHVLAVRVRSDRDNWAFRRALEDQMRTLPGIVSVCFAQFMPMEREDLDDIRISGDAPGTGRLVSANYVSTSFFQTLGIPIVRGRGFRAEDATGNRTEPVVVVSESFAREFWADDDPIGKVIETPDRLRVIGVSRNSRSGRYGGQDGPQLFRLQSPLSTSGSLLVRFQGDGGNVARSVAELLRENGWVENSQPETLKQMMDTTVSGYVAIAKMVLFLGVVALSLAVVSVYSVAAFATGRRTKEFGIRMALGAVRSDIVHLILRSGARPISGGLLGGVSLTIITSYGLTKLMKNAPFELDMKDPLPYLGICVLLFLSSVMAMLIPALRAAKSNPIATLREE
jgi:predicted permease